MYISKFQVLNFKSYRDSTEVEFKPGFNIITGQNSAGKTALLEALTLRFSANPNRSMKTVPVAGVPPDQASTVIMTLVIDGGELLTSLQSMGTNPQWFPACVPNETQATMDNRLLELLQMPELRLSFRFVMRPNGEQWAAEDPRFLGIYGPVQNPNGQRLGFPVVATAAGLSASNGPQVIGQDAELSLASWLRGRIYRFKAERFNVGLHAFGDSPVLLPDAANLPQVLTVLNGNPARFDQLNAVVSEILPQVRRVSVRPYGSNQVEIQVWPHDYKTERADLAISLNECGSGVGQVLAILYLVLTSDHPQTIIIDEPQSFLHPGAVRKLIEVLKKYPQHQYIFATHSPTVITASDPSTFTMVRATDGESVLEIMDPRNTKHLQSFLSEIGARLSDVFGADDILWVEGQTEEACFPLILEKIVERSLMGTAVVGIRQTGDLQARDKKKVLEMYRRLSEARTLLPPAVAFVFDQECLTQEQKDDLTRMDPDRVRFLPRRMYENYLLDPAAVASVMNDIAGFRGQPVLEGEVREVFERRRGERKEGTQQLRYFCRGTIDVPADWENRIDAAKLLEDAFTELSEARASYEKTTHSVAITEWLAANRPEALREVADFLVPLLPR
jgi:predicted ATPase